MRKIKFILAFCSTIIAQTADPFYWSLDFDNDNDYVLLTDVSNLNIEEEITIEAWVNHTDDSGIILYRQNNVTDFDPYYSLFVESGQFRFGLRTSENQSVELNSGINGSGIWHHLAVVRSDSIYFFVDGEKKASTGNIEGSLPIDFPIWFGVNGIVAPLTNFLNGKIDELRIWDRALTQSEIQANLWSEIDPVPGLEGYWRFNTGEGSSVIDHTGNGATGTIANGTWSTNSEKMSRAAPGLVLRKWYKSSEKIVPA